MDRTPSARVVLATALLALPSALGAEAGSGSGDELRPDTAAVAEVVHAFHRALASGDGDAARSLLSSEVRVLEGGGVETLSEYVEHHLPADMAFAEAVERERSALEVFVRGEVAWVVSDSRARGTFRDREIDSRVAELMVLARHGGEWRIEAIHWSSR